MNYMAYVSIRHRFSTSSGKMPSYVPNLNGQLVVDRIRQKLPSLPVQMLLQARLRIGKEKGKAISNKWTT